MDIASIQPHNPNFECDDIGPNTSKDDGFQICVGYSSVECSLEISLKPDELNFDNNHSYHYEIKVYKVETANSDALWSVEPGRSYPFVGTVEDNDKVPFLTTRFSSLIKPSRSVFKMRTQRQADQKKDETLSTRLVDLMPETGQVYEIQFNELDTDESAVKVECCTIQASFNLEELRQLYINADNFADKRIADKKLSNFLVELTEVYRWNCTDYWENLDTNSEGNHVMEVYQKDDNGHKENNINNFLKGLFFATQSKYGKAHFSHCPADKKKFVMPIEKLIDVESMNFYFSDFYCNFIPDSLHYVNIVICNKDSIPDRYCAKKLLPLPQPNKFLKINKTNDGYSFERSCVVWVELFFTHDVLLDDGHLVNEKTKKEDNGTDNLPNRKKCRVCNLYPHQW